MGISSPLIGSGRVPPSAPVSSNAIGILIDDTPSNTIGGTATDAGNVIDSNTAAGVSISGTSATLNLVEGNFIGTNSTGETGLGNLVGVFVGSNNNTVGGIIAGTGNVIGANTSAGVSISGASNIVEGNYIGTDAANDKLDNKVGVFVGSDSNVIGGGPRCRRQHNRLQQFGGNLDQRFEHDV